MNAPFSRSQDAGAVPVSQAAEGLARRAFTISDVEAMTVAGIIPMDERLEVLGGEIVPMSPKGSRHEIIKVGIAAAWGSARPVGYMVASETGLRLDEHTYLEPDFIIYRTDVKLPALKGPNVLLAVEIADSSIDYDLRRKPLIYAAYGVRELWVVDAVRRVIHVHTDVGPGGYGMVTTHQESDRLVPVTAPADFALTLAALPEV